MYQQLLTELLCKIQLREQATCCAILLDSSQYKAYMCCRSPNYDPAWLHTWLAALKRGQLKESDMPITFILVACKRKKINFQLYFRWSFLWVVGEWWTRLKREHSENNRETIDQKHSYFFPVFLAFFWKEPIKGNA